MRSFLSLALLSGLAATSLPLAAQNPTLASASSLGRIAIDRNVLDTDLFKFKFAEVAKAIKYTPYTYRDPSTGKAIAGSTVLTLPNGKKVTAAEYYAELNQHEEFLAQKGFSLQDDAKDDLGTVQKAFSTKELKISQLNLIMGSIKAEQIKESELEVVKSKFTVSSLSAAKMGEIFKLGGLTLNPAAVTPAAGCTSADTLTRTDDWAKRFGDDDWNFRLNAGIKFEATCNRVMGSAEAGTDGAMFSKNFTIAKGKVLAEAVRDKHYRVDMDVLILGKKVFDYDKSQKNKYEVGDKYSKSIPIEIKAKVPVGPIRLSISGGVKGTAEFAYKFKFDGLTALGTVEPSIKADGFAEAGLNAYIAEAGAGANLLLAQVKLPLSALAEVKPQSGKFVAHGKLFGQLILKALDGKVYAYVKVWAPKWNNPFRMKTYRIDITDWDGFILNKTIFNIDVTKVLVNGAS